MGNQNGRPGMPGMPGMGMGGMGGMRKKKEDDKASSVCFSNVFSSQYVCRRKMTKRSGSLQLHRGLGRKRKSTRVLQPPVNSQAVCLNVLFSISAFDATSFTPVMPLTKCRLRKLRLERIKDYLLLEQEFIANQEAIKPSEEKAEVCF